jgi:ABC-2 type transport system ATP-binding protein
MSGPSAVACRGLTKRFGGPAGVLAVDNLDLDVPAGSVFGLLGPNGAGKTTTLRMLTGMARPTAGEATIDGSPVRADDPSVRRSIGILDQAPRAYGWMTGQELVELAGRLSGLPGHRARERAGAVLEQTGLTGAARRRVGGYSGGMRQRLGIAAALVAEPTLLVLDEPVSSLDPEGRRDLLELIADLGGTATVLFSTHVLDDVERVCDRVAILHLGRLVEVSPLDALLDRYTTPSYRLELMPDQTAEVVALRTSLGAARWCADATIDDRVLLVTVTDEAVATAQILPMVAAAGVRLSRFERVRPTLEDVFLRLVGVSPGEATDDTGGVKPDGRPDESHS